jgi:hypothetical protein
VRGLVPIPLLSIACAGQARRNELVAWRKQQAAGQIVGKCRLPKDSLIALSDGSPRRRSQQTETYRRINCALGNLQKRDLISRLPKAFIANERYDGKLN